jgi:hypothetical protein
MFVALDMEGTSQRFEGCHIPSSAVAEIGATILEPSGQLPRFISYLSEFHSETGIEVFTV